METTYHRSATFDRAKIDAKAREAELSCSSETPIARDGFLEVLSHDPANVDLSRLENGAPLLWAHDTSEQIGVVNRVWLAGKRLMARVKFGNSQRAKEVFADVQEGVCRNVSVGYSVNDVLDVTEDAKGNKVRSYSWQPHEVSIVSVPADASVGVGRSYKVTQVMNVSEKIVASAESLQRLYGPDSQQRSNIASLATRYIAEGKSLEQFNEDVVKSVGRASRSHESMPVDAPDIGMTDEDVEGFSIHRAARTLIHNFDNPNNKESCPEFEISQECNRRYERKASGFWIPNEVMQRGKSSFVPRNLRRSQRDLQVNVFNQGGAFVPTLLETTPIEILRNKMVLRALGMQVMGGLTGNVAIPRQTGPATAYSLGEIAGVATSNQSIDQLGMNPKRVAATNNYSKQLLIQSSTDIENFMRNDLLTVCALRADYLGLNGTGGNSEPTGLLNTPGVGSIAFGGTATWQKVLAFEGALAALNADRGKMAYLTTPAVKTAWKGIAVALTGATTVSAHPLWEVDASDPSAGTVNGYPALASNQVLNNGVVFGNFEDLIMGMFGGVDVVVDPYTLAKNAEVAITVNMFLDFVCRHTQSFVISADAGNQ